MQIYLNNIYKKRVEEYQERTLHKLEKTTDKLSKEMGLMFQKKVY